jgi:hypothetical protein
MEHEIFWFNLTTETVYVHVLKAEVGTQHVFQVRNTQFHSFVLVVRKTQLRRFSKFASALCAIPQLRILPLHIPRTIHYILKARQIK